MAGDDFDLQKQTENRSKREVERKKERERLNAKVHGNTPLMTLLCAEEGLLAGRLYGETFNKLNHVLQKDNPALNDWNKVIFLPSGMEKN